MLELLDYIWLDPLIFQYFDKMFVFLVINMYVIVILCVECVLNWCWVSKMVNICNIIKYLVCNFINENDM